MRKTIIFQSRLASIILALLIDIKNQQDSKKKSLTITMTQPVIHSFTVCFQNLNFLIKIGLNQNNKIKKILIKKSLTVRS